LPGLAVDHVVADVRIACRVDPRDRRPAFKVRAGIDAKKYLSSPGRVTAAATKDAFEKIH
jgi:hypothetical protein